jgi:hypothetical protein
VAAVADCLDPATREATTRIPIVVTMAINSTA